MRYAIIGTGAIGGYYGGLLARHRLDVRFLLHTDYEYVRRYGLRIDSNDGNYHLDNVRAYDDTREMPPCDVVIVCLKTTQNHLLKAMLPPILKAESVVLLIQNGIGMEADLLQALPGTRIAAGLAFICSGKVGPGHIHHQYYGKLTVSPYNGLSADDAVFRALIADMKAAGIDVATNANYLQARWRKAVWNIPFNGLTVALNTSTNRLMENVHTLALVKDLMMETVEAANAVNPAVGIDESYADTMIAYTRTMPPYSPSMKLDYDRHHPMEIHYLYERPVSDALAAGYDMRKVKMLLEELLFLQTVIT